MKNERKMLNVENISSIIFVVLTIAMICIRSANGFNVSPVPNIFIREPKALNNSNSYFGFSVNLKANGIFIGAPRAQFDSPNGQFESGAVYKCHLNKTSEGDCQLFNGLQNIENLNGSWLGMSMDSGARDNEAFVVCAPRFTTPCEKRIERDFETYRKYKKQGEYENKIKYEPYELYDKAIHGNCYWINGKMELVVNITMDQLLNDSDIKGVRFLKYYDGQHGFSVHITDDNTEVLMGVLGSAKSRGTVIRKKINTPQTTSQLIDSEVPDPIHWNDGTKRIEDAYFGFSISSGYFDGPDKFKLLYVAGAPKDLHGTGAVYIFDIINGEKNAKMEKHYTFPGERMGERFGYSVLVEDFDNDGFMDIAIGAPYRSSGAVYIYKNRRGNYLNFKSHCILYTTDKDIFRHEMFGAALMKVGDINQDGYNDLIVSAPFEGNGAIYIYHGSSDGLLDKPSQKIHAPSNAVKLDQMFGYGLSKGVDLDGNNYVDFAVGAPNAGAVYIYKTYPVIQIDGSIKPIDEKIPISAKTFDLSACFRYESNHKIEFDVQLRVVVKLIDKFTRAHFQIDGCNEEACELNVTLAPNASSKCISLKASVIFQTNYIYEPIHMELNHSVFNTIPKYDATMENSEFCETCVALDPKSVRNASNVIKFDPGCKHEHCVTDLRVTSALSYNATKCSGRESFKRGDSSLTINYTVENHGESAYSANIYVTLPDHAHFMKIPSTCEQGIAQELISNKTVYICSLTSEAPMFRGDKTTLNIDINTRSLTTIQTIQIEAIASSHTTATGSPIFDNIAHIDNVPVTDYSKIETFGYSDNSEIKIQAVANTQENLTHEFEIKNHGPSNIDSLDVFIYLPTKYIDPVTKNAKELVDIENVSFHNKFEGNKSDIKWSQTPYSDSPDALTTAVSKNDPIRSNLSTVQTIYFECSHSGYSKGEFRITNFESHTSFVITLTFPIDTKKVADIISEAGQDNFVVFTSIVVQKTTEKDCSSVQINPYPYTKFVRSEEKFTPLWIYVVSCVFGTLILELISLAMYKWGFFKRSQHEELKQLKRASQAAPASASRQINKGSSEEIDLDTLADEKNLLD